MTGTPANRAVMIVLSYLWPLAIIPLIVQKDDPEVQWHAKHGLVLMVGELLIVMAAGILTGMMTLSLATFGIGCVISLFVLLLWVAILVLHAIAIIKALSGGRLMVPGISVYAERF